LLKTIHGLGFGGWHELTSFPQCAAVLGSHGQGPYYDGGHERAEPSNIPTAASASASASATPAQAGLQLHEIHEIPSSPRQPAHASASKSWFELQRMASEKARKSLRSIAEFTDSLYPQHWLRSSNNPNSDQARVLHSWFAPSPFVQCCVVAVVRSLRFSASTSACSVASQRCRVTNFQIISSLVCCSRC